MSRICKLFLIVLLSSPAWSVPPFKKGWTQKPPVGTQINWSHPAAQGLVGCWLFNEGGGSRLTDLVTGRVATIGTPSAPWTTGPTGTQIYFANNNGATETFPNTVFPVSVVIIGGLRDSLFNAGTFFSHDSGGNDGWRLRTGTDGTGKVILTFGGIADTTFSTLTMATLNNTYFLAMTITGNLGTAVGYLGLLGNPLTSESQGTLTITGTPSQIAIASSGSGATLDGFVSYILFYNKVIPLSVINQLNENPYCFLRQQASDHSFYFASPAAVVQGSRRLPLMGVR